MLPPHETAKHLGLVHHLAGRYGGYGTPYEDLVGEGSIGLMEAAARFDPERGVKFSTYAWPWIRKFILAALQTDIPTSALMAEMPSPKPEARNDHDVEVGNLLARLEPVERAVIELRFGLGEHHPHTVREAAAALGLSKSSVHRVEAVAVKTMRAA